jgi:molybdenum cofactor cytidylyltransferase
MKISAIVLAAGQSTRMGMIKLLLDLDGGTIVERVVNVLLRSKVDEVIVVVGYEGDRVRRRFLGKDVQVVYNRDYHEGMAASIREGLRHIDQTAHGVLIALGDHPLMTADTIDKLIDTYRKADKGIVCPTYEGKRGHPVIFNFKRYGEALSSLRGDVGGRAVVEAHGDDLFEFTVDSPGVIRDVDVWEEYQKIKRQITAKSDRNKGSNDKGKD